MDSVRAIVDFTAAYRRQWLAPDRLRRFQLERLRAMVDHAWSVAPFYRERWGAQPRLDRLEDLARLPVVSKEDIHDRTADVVAPGCSEANCTVDRTSGSSGLMLTVLTDPDAFRYGAAVWMRSHLAYGLLPHHRMAYYRFSQARRGVVDRLRIFRSWHLRADWPVDRQLDELRRIRPHVLGGYPSHLLALAAGVPTDVLRGLRLKALVSGSETLTPADRERLVGAFGAPVFDLYGCFELGNVAFECRRGQRHVNADAVYLEVVDGGGRPLPPGEPGELVLTGLWNRAMPLVRYRIGDSGALGEGRCACRRGLPMLPLLLGRTRDVVVGADGRRVTQVTVSEAVKGVPGVERYQVRQRADRRVEALVVVRPGVDGDRAAAALGARLADALGGTPVHALVVDELPRGPAGKVRPVVSELA